MKKIIYPLFTLALLYSFYIAGCGDDTVAPEPPTRLVILYSPEWDVVIPDTNVQFRWGTTTSVADSFKLEVSQDSTFAFNVFRFGLTEREKTFNPPGDSNYFYWRVTGYWRAENDSDQSIRQRFKQRN